MLAARRKRAVEAYCAEFCPPALVERTASEVLTAARAKAGGPPTDQGLLEAVREVAAARAPTGTSHQSVCSATPALLAARAGGVLANGELSQLEQHLAGCLRCQATELKSARAERVFATAISDADPAEAVSEPTGVGDEPAPLPTGPVAASAAFAAPPPPAGTHEDAASEIGRAPRRQRRRRGPLLLIALAVIAAAGGGAIALLGGGKSSSNAAPAAVRTTKHTGASAHAVRHRASHVRRHRAARRGHTPHPAAAAHPAVAATSPSTSAPAPAASAPSSGSASSGAGASSSAPASAPAAQSSPARSSGSASGGSSSNGGTGGGSVAAVQQGGLPAQSAPTQGIGSGGPGH